MAEKPRALPRWKDRYWRILRSAVQGIVLAVFLFLFLRTVRGGISPAVANFFPRLDPLLGLTNLLSAKALVAMSVQPGPRSWPPAPNWSRSTRSAYQPAAARCSSRRRAFKSEP